MCPIAPGRVGPRRGGQARDHPTSDPTIEMRGRAVDRSSPWTDMARAYQARQIVLYVRSQPTERSPLLARRTIRRISHVGVIPSVTTRDHDSRHRAVREAATAQVALPAGQDS